MSLLGEFPKLAGSFFDKTSRPTERYNCVAWAAQENDRWWWPEFYPFSYWPPGFDRVATLEVLISVFQARGYELCENGELEEGYEKVVIYARLNRPTHMARQKPSGIWTSKLGKGMDIDHATPQGIENHKYGKAAQYMKRPREQGGDAQ